MLNGLSAVDWGGFELPRIGEGSKPKSSGDAAKLASFSAVHLPPFSLLGKSAGQVKSLAGDETDEHTSQLSLLWQNFASGTLEKGEDPDPRRHQVPRLRQQKALEKWKKAESSGKSAALLMSILWSLLLEIVISFFYFFFLFFVSNSQA
jgi:hypothetical protein